MITNHGRVWQSGRTVLSGRPRAGVSSPSGPADRDIFANVFTMPTTVHIPDALLKSVDRRARALGVSRNRLIVRALEQAVSERSTWTPVFLEQLRRVDEDTAAAVDDLVAGVKQARRSKPPRDL